MPLHGEQELNGNFRGGGFEKFHGKMFEGEEIH